MYSKLLTLICISSLCFVQLAIAQQDTTKVEQLKKEDLPKRLLRVDSPFAKKSDSSRTPINKILDDFDRELTYRIADIYKIQVLALEAQAGNDFVEAETHITDAIDAIRELLNEYPEVQNMRRFSELYRTVLAEYEEFYGITEPGQEVVGEVFAIRENLFNNEDDLAASDFTLPKSFESQKTDVPLLQNRQVNNFLSLFSIRRPEIMEAWFQRYETYKPMMERIFREERVPQELVYLSFIESGLQPVARSRAAAVGLWQFIAATGRVYGLEVNWWVDERRDPEKSTRAAAQHLRDLYNTWGDWHLAIANYNISPRGLKRAIRAAGGKEDYWVAYPYLPRETRGYVPQYIATTMIAQDPVGFGFEEKYEGTPLAYDVFEVDGLVALDDLAKALNITTQELKGLNPELLRWATPPGNKYPLKIPKGSIETFASAYEAIPKEDRAADITFHVVKSGESLGKIARTYGTTVRGIYASNEKLGQVIYPGQRLAIPLPAGSANKLSANRPSNQGATPTRRASSASAPSNSALLRYRVKTGDTVGHIAEWYDVRAFQIRAWNGISNTIRVGQNLKVYVPKNTESYYQQINTLSFRNKQDLERRQRRGENIVAVSPSSSSADYTTYTVKRNDTLSEIAERFKVPLSQLRNLNGISGSRIQVGQKLKISPSR